MSPLFLWYSTVRTLCGRVFDDDGVRGVDNKVPCGRDGPPQNPLVSVLSRVKTSSGTALDTPRRKGESPRTTEMGSRVSTTEKETPTTPDGRISGPRRYRGSVLGLRGRGDKNWYDRLERVSTCTQVSYWCPCVSVKSCIRVCPYEGVTRATRNF